MINDEVIETDFDLNYTSLQSKIEEISDRPEFSFGFFDNSFTYQFETFCDRIDLNLDEAIISTYDAPDYKLICESWHQVLSDALSTISSRQSDVKIGYFGLYNDNPLTLEEIGTSYGLTRERIRQIKYNAILRLRHHNRSTYLRPYLTMFYQIESYAFNDPSFFNQLLFEDESYTIDLLKSFFRPYKRVTAYPLISNQSAECRRLVKKILESNGKPLREEEIKYLILEVYPEIAPSIISYAIKTTPNVIKISKGLYGLESWSYSPSDKFLIARKISSSEKYTHSSSTLSVSSIITQVNISKIANNTSATIVHKPKKIIGDSIIIKIPKVD
jgi:hypothetical protein